MDRIEEIWTRGNDPIGQDASFSNEDILESITGHSIGITSKMVKPVWLGIILAFMAFSMLIYNLFCYKANPAVLVLIILSTAVTAAAFTFLLLQIGHIKKTDSYGASLHEVLVNKIRYLNTGFNTALHCISMLIVIATFTVNLTIESSDGIFELRKLLILSAFYLFAYIMSYSLSRFSLKGYDQQLKYALRNLEESSYRSLDEDMKRHKRNGRIILIVVAIFFLAGIAALFFIA